MSPRSRLLAPAVAILLGVAATPAAAIPLESGVAVVDVDPTLEQVTGWTVNGVAHLRTQQLFVRPGSATSESPITDLTLLSSLASDSDGDGRDDRLAASYTDAGQRFQIDLAWRLTGSAIGDPAVSSSLTLDVTLTALTAPLSLALFAYDDVDLFTSFADDEALFTPPGSASVTDASGLGSWQAEWGLAPGAIEVALWSDTLTSLTDGGVTTLSGAASASGDVTITAVWLFALAPGQPISFSQTQTITVVPEPGSLLLVAAGLALLARRKEAAR